MMPGRGAFAGPFDVAGAADDVPRLLAGAVSTTTSVVDSPSGATCSAR
jgi:hypothetical protein